MNRDVLEGHCGPGDPGGRHKALSPWQLWDWGPAGTPHLMWAWEAEQPGPGGRISSRTVVSPQRQEPERRGCLEKLWFGHDGFEEPVGKGTIVRGVRVWETI